MHPKIMFGPAEIIYPQILQKRPVEPIAVRFLTASLAFCICCLALATTAKSATKRPSRFDKGAGHARGEGPISMPSRVEDKAAAAVLIPRSGGGWKQQRCKKRSRELADPSTVYGMALVTPEAPGREAWGPLGEGAGRVPWSRQLFLRNRQLPSGVLNPVPPESGCSPRDSYEARPGWSRRPRGGGGDLAR